MISLDCYTRINQIPEDVWNMLAGTDAVNLEINHLKAVEISGINNIKPYYFIGYNNHEVIGIAYCFVMQVDFSRISNRYSKEVLMTIKSWKPDFLLLRLIEVGHLASLGKTIEVDESYLSEFLIEFDKAIDEIAKEERADLCLIRDIPLSDYSNYKILETVGFLPAMGYPIAKMDLHWNSFDGYLAALKSKKRYNFLKKRQKLDYPEISIEVIDDYAKYADRLAQLWTNVAIQNNGYEHEKLSPEYFVAISECLKGRSNVIAIKRHDEIIAYGLNLIGDTEFFGVAEGMDYSLRNQYDLYANNFFECIKMACELKKKSVNIGVTAYNYKASIGAEFVACVYFLKAFQKTDFTRVYAKFIEDSIEQPVNFHRVFKNESVDKRLQIKTQVNQILNSDYSIDVFEKHKNYNRIDFARTVDLYTLFPEFESAQEPVIKHNGREVIMLGTNSYLGLATHPKIKQAAIEAIEKYGTGCSGSPLLNGTLDIHNQLTYKLAKCLKKQDALIFSTGYQTNLGVVSTLVGRGDVVIMDERNHASLFDGAMLSRACICKYKHNDLSSLEDVLKKNANKPKLLITDTIFSMEGTLIDLPEIVRLANKYHARLMLDESHAVGVIGENGMGVAEHLGLLNQVDIIMGTFSKSLASVGGFVVGDRKILDMLRHKARSHVFSASLPPSAIATVSKALDIIIAEPQRREKLLDNANYFANGLRKLGFTINYFGSAIISVFCGHELIAVAAFNELFKQGVFVNPVAYPAVPKGEEMLRISLMANHDKQTLEKALKIFEQIKTPTWPRC